jgi:hypothetical protein
MSFVQAADRGAGCTDQLPSLLDSIGNFDRAGACGGISAQWGEAHPESACETKDVGDAPVAVGAMIDGGI